MGVHGERRRQGAHGPDKGACGDKYEREHMVQIREHVEISTKGETKGLE